MLPKKNSLKINLKCKAMNCIIIEGVVNLKFLSSRKYEIIGALLLSFFYFIVIFILFAVTVL